MSVDVLPSRLLSEGYRAQLDVARARAVLAVEHATVLAQASTAPAAEWASNAPGLRVVIERAQSDVYRITARMLASQIEDATGLITPNPADLLIPADQVVGTTGSSQTVASTLANTSDVIISYVAQGMTLYDATGLAGRWVGGHVAASEPHRVARALIATAGSVPVVGEVWDGWRRVPEPGACKFCRMLATRGAVYKSRRSAQRTSAGELYHPRCKCEAVAVLDPDAAYALEAAGQSEWERMLKAGQAPRIRGSRDPITGELPGATYEDYLRKARARHPNDVPQTATP